MKDKYILISCISFPALAIAFIVLAMNTEDRPMISESTYRQALEMYEAKEERPSSVILASDVFKSKTTIGKNKTDISYIDVFTDKFSLPFEQLAYLIEELEGEHASIISQHHYQDLKIDPVLALKPRFRIVLAIYLETNPANLTVDQLKKLKLSSNEELNLKNFSYSNDFVLMLQKNEISKNYLSIKNLQKIYGRNHQVRHEGRSVSHSSSE